MLGARYVWATLHTCWHACLPKMLITTRMANRRTAMAPSRSRVVVSEEREVGGQYWAAHLIASPHLQPHVLIVRDLGAGDGAKHLWCKQPFTWLCCTLLENHSSNSTTACLKMLTNSCGTQSLPTWNLLLLLYPVPGFSPTGYLK
jgi:hypothetical protein